MPASTKTNRLPILKQNVGVDIAKLEFKASFWELRADQSTRIKGSRTFNNTPTGFKHFLTWVTKKTVTDCSVQITLEATGVYHEQLSHFLYDNAYRVNIILPNLGKAYARSLNLKSKTDKVDAAMLGRLGIERNLFEWKPTSPNVLIIKQLCRDRVQILNTKTALLNRMGALLSSYEPNPSAIKRMKQRLNLLELQLKEVNAEIETNIKKDNILHQKVDNICQIKGVSLITVAAIIAETNGFELFTAREQVVSYAGYDVVQRQSGSSIKGKTKISKKGNKFIRRALYFPAICVVKYEPKFKQMYERIVKKSKAKMVAYVAIQRKILLLIYALFKSGKTYDPNYKEQQQNEKKILKSAITANL